MTVELHTDRLYLRPPRPGDVEPLWKVFGDPEVTRFIGGGADWPREDVENLVRRSMAFWAEHGFGFFIVESRGEDPVVLGDCGLIPIPFSGQGGKRGPDIELGYRLGAAHWGKGYATEAAREVLRFGTEDLRLDRIVAVTNPENRASQRVLAKIGFSDCGLTDRYYDHVTHLFEYRTPG